MNSSSKSNMVIEIAKEKGRPVNYKQSAKLSSELGIIARNLIPVPAKWKSLSDEDKQLAFERLKGRFQIDLECLYVKTSCEDILKDVSRNERYRLRKKFKILSAKYNTVDEVGQHPPNNKSEGN